MIEVVTPVNAWRYRAALAEMFRLRRRVFHDLLGWTVDVKNGEERDAYDDLDPVYALAFDDAGRLIGSFRFLPTTGPYMLRDVFLKLLDGETPPVDPAVWEVSRFVVDRDRLGRDGLNTVGRTTAMLFAAGAEIGLAYGIEEIVTVCNASVARIPPRMGLTPIWRGKKHRLGRELVVAERWPNNAAVLATIRQRAGIEGSVLARPIEGWPRVAA